MFLTQARTIVHTLFMNLLDETRGLLNKAKAANFTVKEICDKAGVGRRWYEKVFLTGETKNPGSTLVQQLHDSLQLMLDEDDRAA